MSNWEKQEWIKDILSKSGTEITEIKDVKNEDLRKMVYYTTALMQSADQSECSSAVGTIEGHSMYQLTSPSSTSQHGSHPSQFTNLTSSSFNTLGKVQELQVLQSTPTGTHVTQKLQFKCEQCNMCFGSKSAHTSHMKSHTKQFQQQSINGQVGTSPSPPSSSSSNTSSDPYQCDVCKKTFAVPARLVRHYRTHTGERPFECEFCHKMFSVKENLQVHRRIHTKERPYKCDVCGRAFEHSGKLHRHMRIHTGERPHKCSVCGKTFIQSGQLVIHMRTHTGEKPYKCPVDGCGKGFTCSKQLKVHSRTHTGEKPYHCDICFRDFGYNHVLKLHRVQHYGSKCYKCTICDETFKSKKEMEAHIKGHANSDPDEEEMDQSSASSSTENVSVGLMGQAVGNKTVPIGNNLSKYGTETLSPETTNSSSDTDDVVFYNMYPPTTPAYERTFVSGEQKSMGGVNPALLAAVSIEMANNKNKLGEELNATEQLHPPAPAAIPTSSSDAHVSPEGVVANGNRSITSAGFETISGYFAATQHVPEYRSSSNDIVRCVEAALASAEPSSSNRGAPLLTPPRSSPESRSPDRSSSPECDSILMADRDIMSLPPRKRKLYLKDQSLPPPSTSSMMQENVDALPPKPPFSTPSNTVSNSAAISQRRMGSVIQFANKAS